MYLYIYIYTYTYKHKQTFTNTYIWIIFINLIEFSLLIHNYFSCHTALVKCFRVTLECFFLSEVGLLPYLHLVLSFLYIIEMPWAQNLSVVSIKLFVGTPKILNHRILMMKYWSADKEYVQWRKKTCPFCRNADMQI